MQNLDGILLERDTVDGRTPEPAEGKVIYPFIYKAFLIHPRSFSRRISEPSTVWMNISIRSDGELEAYDAMTFWTTLDNANGLPTFSRFELKIKLNKPFILG